MSFLLLSSEDPEFANQNPPKMFESLRELREYLESVEHQLHVSIWEKQDDGTFKNVTLEAERWEI